MSDPSDNKPFKESFEEFAANVLNRTMYDNCLDEFPDDAMNYDPNVRDSAPVCNECYEALTSDGIRITYIPATNRPGLNPETSAAIDDLVQTAAREIAERGQRANESANVWVDAFEQGGEDAARKALEEHLQKYQTLPSDEE